MPDLWDVDYWVEEAALLPIAKFYPSAITASTSVPVEDVLHKLLTFVEEERLFIRWQIRCQSYDCVRTIAEVDDVHELVGSVVRCLCGEEYEISSDMLFPVFGFERHFRDKIRERAKKKNITCYAAQTRGFEQHSSATYRTCGSVQSTRYGVASTSITGCCRSAHTST